MNAWAVVMLVSAGVFAGSVFAFAWERIPAWRAEPPQRFKDEFAGTIAVADRLQPMLLAVAIVAASGFALNADAGARLFAFVGAAGLSVTMIASLAILVPLQRRIIKSSDSDATVDEMRARWFNGHIGRTVLAVLSFGALAAAVSV
jgi:hypothetical protein